MKTLIEHHINFLIVIIFYQILNLNLQRFLVILLYVHVYSFRFGCRVQFNDWSTKYIIYFMHCTCISKLGQYSNLNNACHFGLNIMQSYNRLDSYGTFLEIFQKFSMVRLCERTLSVYLFQIRPWGIYRLINKWLFCSSTHCVRPTGSGIDLQGLYSISIQVTFCCALLLWQQSGPAHSCQ